VKNRTPSLYPHFYFAKEIINEKIQKSFLPFHHSAAGGITGPKLFESIGRLRFASGNFVAWF
jgi:hypothetical protein